MRARAHVTLATGVLGLAALACRGAPRTTPFDASDVDASAEAAKLGALLPPSLGPFTATDPAMSVTGPGLLIEAQRSYADSSGKKADVQLETGDLRSDLGRVRGDRGAARFQGDRGEWRRRRPGRNEVDCRDEAWS